ncbi:hypothetical protein ADK86_39970 [Streptomyces sp. NRRL F-5755]|nr:hypothetical protein ADK86_39970 [Streptomyces sp. NRRL F-5755]
MAVASPLLVGTAPPAVAADDAQKAAIDQSLYTSEGQIIQALEKGTEKDEKNGIEGHPPWAPIEKIEAVMGYPKGIDKENPPAELDHVKKLYDPKTAVADAKKKAKEYTQNTKNPKSSRDLAQELVNSPFDGPEELQNTNTPVDGMGTTVEEHCAGKSRYFQGKQPKNSPNSCLFVGQVDEDSKDGKYPKAKESPALVGGGEKSITTEGQATHENSTTEGWKYGGKFSGELNATPAGDKGGPGGKGSAEFNFEYSYSITATEKVTNIVRDTTTVKFPEGNKQNTLQGRRNGAYYYGYIVIPRKETKPENGKEGYEHLVVVPARVYVQSSKTTSAMTFFKLQQ